MVQSIPEISSPVSSIATSVTLRRCRACFRIIRLRAAELLGETGFPQTFAARDTRQTRRGPSLTQSPESPRDRLDDFSAPGRFNSSRSWASCGFPFAARRTVREFYAQSEGGFRLYQALARPDKMPPSELGWLACSAARSSVSSAARLLHRSRHGPSSQRGSIVWPFIILPIPHPN